MLLPVLLLLVSSKQRSVEPIAYWSLKESRYQDGQIVALKGPNLMVSGFPREDKVDGAIGLRLKERGDEIVYPWDERNHWSQMPKRDFTVSVSFATQTKKGTEGLIACIFEPGEGLTGWRILLKDGKVEFTLASHDAQSKGGQVSILDDQELSVGRLHKVDASYDGEQIRLYVDGNLKKSASAKLGDIVYNGRAGVCFGGWWEGPRSFGFQGFYSQAALFDRALNPSEVNASLETTPIKPMPEAEGGEQKLTIAPYFQYPTTHSATVMWETSRTAPSKVRFGESVAQAKEIQGKAGRIHQVELTGLKPATTYFVQVDSSDVRGKVVTEWTNFRTAALPGTPVKFAVVGDTQDHPEVNHQVAAGIFAERPDFAMVVGDLVGCGWFKNQWVDDFFGSMRPLFSHVPLLPVMGNHDRNARLYYDLMAVPAPEYYYSYQTGDVEIWVIDTEHDISPKSEQYRWLENGLKRSRAKWKVVAHHYPPYSSDLDDFGDSNKEQIEGGDLGTRVLCPLYDKYHVDVCFSGHIHSYERTYPLRAGKTVPEGKGTVYMVVGGGGGGLEEAAHTHAAFSHTVRYGHHYGIVWADENRFEFKAYDIDGRLFDSFELKK